MAANTANASGWLQDKLNARLNFYYDGTLVGYVDATGLYVNGTAVTANVINDGIVFALGTDSDVALVERASILNANTALTGVVIGTPVTPAVAANSLILSNTTASGDILVITNTGGNSLGWLWIDASASLMTLQGLGVSAIEIGTGTVVNESGADRDFRIEGDTNTNMVVVDAGTDSAALGSAVVAGAPLSISNLTGRTLVTAVGNAVHIPAGSLTDGGVTGTIANLYTTMIGARTIIATNTITYTTAAGLNVENPVASTGATFTNIRSIRSAGNIQIGAAAAFASTQPTGSLVMKSSTAPAGAVTTSGAIWSSDTVLNKIIADGTVSQIEA